MVKHFTSKDLTQQALAGQGTVLVDFWAPWCGPCRMIAPIIEQLAGEYSGRAAVGKLNIDEEQDAAVSYRVTSIPTLILFKDGVEQERMIGARGKEALEELLDKYCSVV
ncbi:thioredoxin [Bacillota bacterium Meth-B3]|nr:thioredoxin [Christensenellaceae bacterium]MEA5065427.1 thioredoxin [Eubacteriales bacterium]MEA5068910.1 thioredoxin [Christensenellaceae bacterium]